MVNFISGFIIGAISGGTISFFFLALLIASRDGDKYRHDEQSYSVKCSNRDCPVIPITYESLEEIDAINNWNRRYENENRID